MINNFFATIFWRFLANIDVFSINFLRTSEIPSIDFLWPCGIQSTFYDPVKIRAFNHINPWFQLSPSPNNPVTFNSFKFCWNYLVTIAFVTGYPQYSCACIKNSRKYVKSQLIGDKIIDVKFLELNQSLNWPYSAQKSFQPLLSAWAWLS